MDLSPLFISIKTALFATAFAFVLGILAAYFVLKRQRFKSLADAVFTLPMVLPPTVVGFFLLLAFGKNSWIGQLLETMNLSVIFSWGGTVIASTVVAFPLMYRTALSAFEQVDENLFAAARTLGISETAIFMKILLPNSLPGIVAGTILSFARAMGEFGATIMVAGNIPGRTQTMALAVYSATQSGNRELAFKWVLVIVALSFTAILSVNAWNSWLSRKKAGNLQ